MRTLWRFALMFILIAFLFLAAANVPDTRLQAPFPVTPLPVLAPDLDSPPRSQRSNSAVAEPGRLPPPTGAPRRATETNVLPAFSEVQVWGRVFSPRPTSGFTLLFAKAFEKPHDTEVASCRIGKAKQFRITLPAPGAYSVSLQEMPGIQRFAEIRVDGTSPYLHDDLTVPETKTVRVHVIDGLPHARARVPLLVFHNEFPLWSLQELTSDDGAWSQELPPGSYGLKAGDSRQGPFSQRTFEVSDQDPLDLEVKLVIPRVKISGRVQDEKTGKPIPDARIWLIQDKTSGARDALTRFPTAISDQKGRFSAAATEGGKLDLAVRAENFQPRRVVLDTSDGDARRDITVELSEGKQAAGLVVDGKGRAVARAQVHIRQRLEAGGGEESVVLTDAEGNFRTAGLKSGEVFIWASYPHLGSELMRVNLPVEHLVLTVVPLPLIRGTLSDPEGRLFTGRFTALLRREGDGEGPAIFPVRGSFQDRWGRFSLLSPPPGIYRLVLFPEIKSTPPEAIFSSTISSPLSLTSGGRDILVALQLERPPH